MKRFTDDIRSKVQVIRQFLAGEIFKQKTLRASQLYSGGDCRLADQTERTPCP